MKLLPRLLLSLVALALALAASAADKRPITPQDLWALKRVSSPTLSPDGKLAVVSVQEWSVDKNKSTSNLWLVDVAAGTSRKLTTAAVSDGSPVFSPDGTRLAFTSKRGDDENGALYLMRLDGGEPEKLVELPYAVSSPKWLPDGSGLVVVTRVIPELAGKLAKDDLAAMKKEIKRRKDSKISAKATEDRAFRYWDAWLTDNLANRLVRVDVATKEIRDLTPGYSQLFQVSGTVNYDIAPDGKAIAIGLESVPRPYDGFLNSDVYLLPTDGSGTLKNLTPDNQGNDDDPAFSPDGAAIVYSRTETAFYNGEFEKLWRHDVAAGRNTPLTETLDYSVSGVEFSADGKALWLTIEDKGVVPVFRLNADGTGLTAVYRPGSSSAIKVAGDTLIFLNTTSSRPDELFALDPKTGAARQLTHFNDELLAQFDFGRVEEYWFDGANGAKIHGWLTYPPGFDSAKSYPLLQLMHGGPHTMNRDSWSYRWNAHVMAAPGYVVTWINRHGSTGFGEKFCQAIIGEWGDKPLEDILKGTDYLLKKLPNLDPKKMAAAGGSYGGYMAAWVAGHTDRFACIINHAGVNDFITQYGADVTSFGFSQVLGGKPWENVEGMQRNNPTTYAKNFKTPMLIIHGEKDYRVPYVNGTALYGIYRAMGLPARLVIFPDENHWVLTPQNAIYWNWEFQSWLARYLGGTPTLKEPRFDAEAK